MPFTRICWMQDDHNGCFLALVSMEKQHSQHIVSAYKICFKNFPKLKTLATQATGLFLQFMFSSIWTDITEENKAEV